MDRRATYNEEVRREAARLYVEEGLSVRQIASTLDRSITRVHTYLTEMDVVMRPVGARHKARD